MLNFINKKGKKVMELKDDGELNILNEELKKSFKVESIKESIKKEETND
ncbi:hypothetical protein ABFV99_13480 [Cytobacillus horneckiae]